MFTAKQTSSHRHRGYCHRNHSPRQNKLKPRQAKSIIEWRKDTNAPRGGSFLDATCRGLWSGTVAGSWSLANLGYGLQGAVDTVLVVNYGDNSGRRWRRVGVRGGLGGGESKGNVTCSDQNPVTATPNLFRAWCAILPPVTICISYILGGFFYTKRFCQNWSQGIYIATALHSAFLIIVGSITAINGFVCLQLDS
jgi:hypothetical protein